VLARAKLFMHTRLTRGGEVVQLELEAVSKTYVNGTRALDAVTLQIPRGIDCQSDHAVGPDTVP
jgi:hypothetical protein